MRKRISGIKRNGKWPEQPGQLALQLAMGCTLSVKSVGLLLPETLNFDEWRRGAGFFKDARLSEESVQWQLADWLAFGGERFCETDPVTGKYKQSPAFQRYLKAAEMTGYDESKLKELAYVGHAVPLDVRMPPGELSFAHHAVVAAIPNDRQAAWLAKAKREGWTVSEFRQAIRRELAANDPQSRLPLVNGVNLIGLASEIESRFRKMELQMPLDKWPTEQRQAIRSDAMKIREVADGIIARTS